MLNFKKAIYFTGFFSLLISNTVCAEDCAKALKNPLSSEWQTPDFVRQCPLASKMTKWMILREGKTGSFADYASFIQSNPEWPWEHKLRRNAEEKMNGTESLSVLRSFYAKSAPKTFKAAILYINKLDDAAHHEEATKKARQVWHSLEGTDTEQRDFYNAFQKRLRDQDHEARAIFLAKAENFKASEKVVNCIKGPRRQVLERWISLLSQKKDIPDFSKVPFTKKDDWVVFQYVRQLRKKYDPRAEQILIRYPQYTQSNPELWWRERSVLSRRAVEKGDYTLAYKVVKHHNLGSGSDFSDAEFFLGWTALRFLGQPKIALSHFQSLYENVKSPISLAKGAYWLGRTYEALHQKQQARHWFEEASKYKTAYYGQVAQRKLMNQNGGKPLHKIIVPQAAKARFESREFVRAARLFVAAGLPKEALSFLHLLAKRSKSDSERFLTIQLTNQLAQQYVVDIVREITPHTETAYMEAYPRLQQKYDFQGVDPDFVHAVIRRESGFNSGLVSDKDAQGLMQVMPDTGQKLAVKYNFKYDAGRLLNDPSYNIKVGCIFLKRLIDSYKGSFVLTLAAYNAGPKPVQEWVQYFGDPRDNDVDMIDWIEKISYKETREYIQRVLEAYVVYKYYRK